MGRRRPLDVFFEYSQRRKSLRPSKEDKLVAFLYDYVLNARVISWGSQSHKLFSLIRSPQLSSRMAVVRRVFAASDSAVLLRGCLRNHAAPAVNSARHLCEMQSTRGRISQRSGRFGWQDPSSAAVAAPAVAVDRKR